MTKSSGAGSEVTSFSISVVDILVSCHVLDNTASLSMGDPTKYLKDKGSSTLNFFLFPIRTHGNELISRIRGVLGIDRHFEAFHKCSTLLG